MKKIFLSVALFLFGTLRPTTPHDFKSAYMQTTQTLTYPAFLIRVANNAKTPRNARKAACDELLTRDDLSPDNALDVVISLVALKNAHQKLDELDPAELVSTTIECIEQSPALPVPAWAKVVLETTKECLSKIPLGSSGEDIKADEDLRAIIVQPIDEVLEKYDNEISQSCANSNVYAYYAIKHPDLFLTYCDPAYSCKAEEEFYEEATL
jgi:hypothetical protein